MENSDDGLKFLTVVTSTILLMMILFILKFDQVTVILSLTNCISN